MFVFFCSFLSFFGISVAFAIARFPTRFIGGIYWGEGEQGSVFVQTPFLVGLVVGCHHVTHLEFFYEF